MRHTRARKRKSPSTCSSDQSMSFSGGAAKSMNMRTVSAPKRATIGPGATTLPHRFDIFRPSGPFTMPWVTSRLQGSSSCTSPSPCITRCQNRK